MLILLSPAKSLDYDSELLTGRSSVPRLLDDSEELVGILRKLSAKQVGDLMGVSEKLAELNAERFQVWERDFTKENSRAAILAFTGDVYQGMELGEWSDADFLLAQKRVRILSGLYGVLRPLDLMQAYRLEMGTRLENKRGKNLYEFWGDKVTEVLNRDLKGSGNELVVNLASQEYFKSVKSKLLDGELITPVFKDEKGGKYKIIAFFAKKARGMMADYLVRNEVTDVAGLKKFKTAGYKYCAKESKGGEIVFLRKEQAK